jgi:CoA:oxalate CoA-transferase
VTEWTQGLSKAEVFATASRYRIPCAPVLTVVEVMRDPHMHERGYLERVQHPDFGEVTLPGSPLRLHGAEHVAAVPSVALGQHNGQVFGAWLGLSTSELEILKQDGVI